MLKREDSQDSSFEKLVAPIIQETKRSLFFLFLAISISVIVSCYFEERDINALFSSRGIYKSTAEEG